MAMPRELRSDRARRRRDELLDVAAELFAARDYEHVSVDDVAEAAGASHGLVFQYFGSKKGLYLAVVDRLIGRFAEQVGEAQRQGDPLAVLGAYLDWAATHPDAYRSMMLGPFAEARELVDRSREDGLRGIAEGFGIDLEADRALWIALRGWSGLNERATLAWLDAPEVPRDEVLRITADALDAVLRSHGLVAT